MLSFFLISPVTAGTDYKCAIRHDECDKSDPKKLCYPHPTDKKTWRCKTKMNFEKPCTLTEDVGECINHYKPDNIEYGLEHPLLFLGGFSNSKLFLEDAGMSCAEGAGIEGDQIFPPVEALFMKLGAKMVPEVLKDIGETNVTAEVMEEAENRTKQCYSELLALNPEQDGWQGQKLRAAKTFDLSSGARKIPTEILTFFTQVGYVEGKTFKYMPYDFRLSPDHAQRRDGQCDIFKQLIEEMVSENKKPVVVVSHSNGGNMALSCFQLISRNEGKQWFDDNVQSFVPIAMPIAGAKDITLEAHGLSEDVQEILQLKGAPAEIRMKASDMFRSWPGTQLLFPRGGNNLWLSKEFVEFGWHWENITQYCDDMKKFWTPLDNDIPLCDISPEKVESPPIFDHFRNALAPLKSMYCLFGGGIPTLSKIIMNKDVDDKVPISDRHWEALQYNDDGDGSVGNISGDYMCRVWQTEPKYRQSEDTHIASKQYIHTEMPPNMRKESNKDFASAKHSPLLANVELAMDLLTIAASRPVKSDDETAALYPKLPRENELNLNAKNNFYILDQTRAQKWFHVVDLSKQDEEAIP